MAGIDKIYGSDVQYDIFWDWSKRNNKELLDYFYPRDDFDCTFDRPITNLPTRLDKWLLKNCPLQRR